MKRNYNWQLREVVSNAHRAVPDLAEHDTVNEAEQPARWSINNRRALHIPERDSSDSAEL